MSNPKTKEVGNLRAGFSDGQRRKTSGTGSVLELGDGQRLVRGASCAVAFSDLVASAAVLLDPSQTQAPNKPADPDVVTVRVETTKPGVVVAEIVGRGSAVSSSGSAISAVYTEDICEAPCSFTIPPGLRELSVYGKGTIPKSLKLNLSDPEVVLQHRPRPLVTRWVGAGFLTTGIVAAVVGGVPFLDDCSTGSFIAECQRDQFFGAIALGAGAVSLGIGIPLVLTKTKFEQVSPQ